MNQSQFLAITCNSLEAREKSRVHGVIGFGYDSRWLKNRRESFKPITKLSNRNYGITFDSHLKTALIDFKISRQNQSHLARAIFPRFEQVTSTCLKFWLVHRLVCPCSDWSTSKIWIFNNNSFFSVAVVAGEAQSLSSQTNYPWIFRLMCNSRDYYMGV